MPRVRALARSLEQLHLSPHASVSALRAPTTRRFVTKPKRRHTAASPLHSSRAFSTTRLSQQDGPASSGAPAQQHPQERPRRSIDLSSITSNANYRPPPRPTHTQGPPNPTKPSASVRETTQIAINRLLASNRKSAQEGAQPSSRYNNDVYGSSMFKQRTPIATRPGPSGDTWTIDTLMDNLPMRSKNADGSLANSNDPYGELLAAPLRLKPSLGRTVTINENANFDLTRAFVTLESRINRSGNSVRMDERNQKFHVRKGQARKLHRRARWRILFREGFLQEVTRVKKMIRQGW